MRTTSNNDPLNKIDPLGLRQGEETFSEKGEPDWTYDKWYHLWNMDPDEVVLEATGHTSFGIVSLWMGEVMNEPSRIFLFVITAGSIVPGNDLCTQPRVIVCDPVGLPVHLEQDRLVSHRACHGLRGPRLGSCVGR